jgi:hypothetical protein
MGAPTWPPDPEKAFEETAREYGVRPGDIGADEDEEFERALLAVFLFESPKRQLVSGQDNGTPLSQLQKGLEAYLRMVSGMPVRVAASDPPSTDGRSVFLPRAVPAPAEPGDHALYRAMGLVQLGLLRFGLLEGERLLEDVYRDWVLRSCYHLLAAQLVVDRWSAAFPGLAQDFARLRVMDKAGVMRINLTEVPREGMPGGFVPLYRGLTSCLNWDEPGSEGEPARQAMAAVRALTRDSETARGGEPPSPREQATARAVLLGQANRLRQAFKGMRLGPPPLPYFIGILRPEWILAHGARDLAAENAWRDGPTPLRQLRAAQARGSEAPAAQPETRRRPGLRSRLKQRIGKALQGPGDPEELRRAPAYGMLRDEHQQKRQEREEGVPRWSPDTPVEELLAAADAALPQPEEGTPHDEWNELEGAYIVGATRVIERPAPVGPIGSYQRLVAANGRRIHEIRRQFEKLRLEERWLHGQLDGSQLDLDRAVRACCDIAAGQDPDPRVFMRYQRQRQQVAILTLVDLSGSTQGHVVHLEQEALVLFAEGLRTLRFPHAFYGFHNDGPDRCWFERIKAFEEGYDETVLKRMANLQPSGATRMGAFLRHGAALLAKRPQGRRILLVLSDGRPEDREPYRGAYGLRDTAMAVQEAAKLGVHCFCISLDGGHDAPEYLAKVFGPGRFLALKQVEALPRRLPEVFARLIR